MAENDGTFDELVQNSEVALLVSRCLQLLGLALRARLAVVGSDLVLQAVRLGNAKLVWVSTDIGQNAAKKYDDKCAYYHVPLVKRCSRAELGKALGRSHCVAAAVTDPGLAAKILKYAGEFGGGDAIDETAGV